MMQEMLLPSKYVSVLEMRDIYIIFIRKTECGAQF